MANRRSWDLEAPSRCFARLAPLLPLLLLLAATQAPSDALARKPRAAHKAKAEKGRSGKKPKSFGKQLTKALRVFEAGKWEKAIVELRLALSIQSLPKLLVKIAQANRKLGREQEALAAYEEFLRTDSEPEPEMKAEAEAYIKEARAKVAAAGDGKPAAGAPTPGDGAQASGAAAPAQGKPPLDQEAQERAAKEAKEQAEKEAQERAAKEAKEREEKERLAAAEKPATATRAQPDAELPVLVAKTPATPPKQPLHKKWWLWTGVGAAAAVVLGVTLGVTLGAGPAPPPDPMLPLGLDVRNQRF